MRASARPQTLGGRTGMRALPLVGRPGMTRRCRARREPRPGSARGAMLELSTWGLVRLGSKGALVTSPTARELRARGASATRQAATSAPTEPASPLTPARE